MAATKKNLSVVKARVVAATRVAISDIAINIPPPILPHPNTWNKDQRSQALSNDTQQTEVRSTRAIRLAAALEEQARLRDEEEQAA